MPPCVTSAMSVGNLSQQIRDNGDISTNSSSNPSNNNNRVNNAMSVGNISKFQGTKVTGESTKKNQLSKFHLYVFPCFIFMLTFIHRPENTQEAKKTRQVPNH